LVFVEPVNNRGMVNPVPAGSDIDVGSTKHLPPCPSCGNGQWLAVTGGDAAADPCPES
jgi:hypothetical protein